MADDKLISFLSELQEAFDDSRLSDMTEFFTLPLVIYSVAGVTVVRSKEELIGLTEQYRSAIGSLQVTSSKFVIQHREAPCNRRLRATVRFTDFQEDGKAVTGSLIRYFLLEEDGSYKIEMLEYLEAPFSVSEVERIVH